MAELGLLAAAAPERGEYLEQNLIDKNHRRFFPFSLRHKLADEKCRLKEKKVAIFDLPLFPHCPFLPVIIQFPFSLLCLSQNSIF